ncbi:hypothetical protein PR048_014794 [Dryococelus australis]|uniref:Uncharacterized protein n=1 Tax=Dryococelus australis TaxID=614101 RepID=A0ABQ9HFE2_9NEOP|nr:hypothetical protein PR048_014794 [Dryococelus australis]
MKIDGRCCYDPTDDEILCPSEDVQETMARGLASKWEQPIFYDFDSKVTRELLVHVIVALAERGFIVVAVY